MTTITALDEYKKTYKLAREKYIKKNKMLLLKHKLAKSLVLIEFIKSRDIAQVKLANAKEAQMKIK